MPLDQQRDSAEMPFLDHLEELRWRILKSVVALAVGFAAAFWFCLNMDVIALLAAPIKPYLGPDGTLVFTHPLGNVTILMQIAGVLGIVLASPMVGYQIWSFLVPALTPRERRVITPVLAFAALLFLAGVALAVFLFVPVTFRLLQGFQSEALRPMITATDYFGFMIFIAVAFGALFELPILALVFTALGLVTPQGLSRMRRYAAVISYMACAVLTPGDFLVTTLILWLPVYGLYELSILVSWFVYRIRKRREAAAEAIGAGAPA